jgi:hypothetical protein
VNRAQSDRISRRLIRKMLAGARCAACERLVDEHAHLAVLFAGAAAYRHLICAACWANDLDEVSRRVELNLLPAKGRA